eukprot:12669-Eustigmatos_ZCMA.PRE.1
MVFVDGQGADAFDTVTLSKHVRHHVQLAAQLVGQRGVAATADQLQRYSHHQRRALGHVRGGLLGPFGVGTASQIGQDALN